MDRKRSLFEALAAHVLSLLTPRRAARQEALRRAQNRLDWARSRGHWAGSDQMAADKVGGAK
jgi:hypothetical protein